VAHVIPTFGRADQRKREGVVRLCRTIGRVCGLEVGDGGGEGVSERPREAGTAALVEGVSWVGSRRLGLVWIVEALWERLGIGPTVRRVVGDGAELERALLAMTANRLCDPQSKLGVWERWRERV